MKQNFVSAGFLAKLADDSQLNVTRPTTAYGTAMVRSHEFTLSLNSALPFFSIWLNDTYLNESLAGPLPCSDFCLRTALRGKPFPERQSIIRYRI